MTERLTEEESLRDRIDRLHANLNGEWTPSAIEIVVEKETEVLRRERDELRDRVDRLLARLAKGEKWSSTT